MKFEKVENFKYLGVEINVLGDNYKEIRNIMNLDDKCFFALNTIGSQSEPSIDII